MAGMTVAQLRAALRANNLSASGTKAVLEARLEEFQAMNPEASQEEEEEEDPIEALEDEELRETLASHGMSSRGSRAVLEKRLRTAVNKGKATVAAQSGAAKKKKTAPAPAKRTAAATAATKKNATVDVETTRVSGRKRKRSARVEEEEEAEEEAEEEEEEAASYTGMNVAQLRAACKRQGLAFKGNKAALISRLQAQLLQPEAPAETVNAETEEAEATADEEDDYVAEPPKKKKKKAETSSGAIRSKGKATVDPYAPQSAHIEVLDDWACMLNQTNIAGNNNKFYVIQLLRGPAGHATFTRWGRVGEPGQNKLFPWGGLEQAEKIFKKKFYDKTKNQWGTTDFRVFPNKYTHIAMSYEEDKEEMESKLAKLSSGEEESDQVKVKTLESKLDLPTQQFISLIFNDSMFKAEMAKFDLDVKRMPLGALSKEQIARGFQTLMKIKEVMANKQSGNLVELSNEFYSRIPHSFGRKQPPPIRSAEHLQKKMDMLSVLGDIEIAVGMEKKEKEQLAKAKKNATGNVIVVPHHLDKHYESLKADLELIDNKSDEFKIIQEYASNTSQGYRRWKKIKHVWKVNRAGEAERFAAHDAIENRKLLWHGTSVAVVAAILNSGFRIMPHSGGRVGRGIYLASENAKSAAYVGTSKGTGIMFLGEAALGREHHITRDDPSLRKAPNGYDSIIAKGKQEPDPAFDKSITIDGKKVIVPVGVPKPQAQYNSSSFYNSEYLLYKESQARIRYVIEMQF